MSSITDLIKKQYEKEAIDRFKEKKVTIKREKKPKKSVVETDNMKRISLWIDKKAYNEIQDIVAVLKEDLMARVYANESELIRNAIRKGVPEVLDEFRRMFPKLKL